MARGEIDPVNLGPDPPGKGDLFRRRYCANDSCSVVLSSSDLLRGKTYHSTACRRNAQYMRTSSERKRELVAKAAEDLALAKRDLAKKAKHLDAEATARIRAVEVAAVRKITRLRAEIAELRARNAELREENREARKDARAAQRVARASAERLRHLLLVCTCSAIERVKLPNGYRR